ncbi:exodeoxyribonuclease VII small subunit [Candidatus Avelusimicrobium aviculae]|uniref:exodeoxyribonuclease VII small subunit n=1 Tax=Candidatus Avelusimicrobium aviculae TaxID=3416206 RepID=UPI003D0DF712
MTTKKTFEAQLVRLEEIVSALEAEQTDLDASVKLFEEGMALSQALSAKLEDVKFKVNALKRQGESLSLTPFDAQEADDDAE